MDVLAIKCRRRFVSSVYSLYLPGGVEGIRGAAAHLDVASGKLLQRVEDHRLLGFDG